MNLFSLAERMGAADRPPVVLHTVQCVHVGDRFSKCEACVRACATGALRLDKPVALDDKVCVACGACLPVCPVGAISGADGVDDLLKCTARLNPDILELACARHPAPENGLSAAATVIRTDHCLAALGPSVYLWLLGGSVKQIIVRLDACAGCAIGKTQTQISRTLAAARHLLSARGEADRLVAMDAPAGDSNKTRPVQLAKNPPLSRRDLFRVLAAEGPKLAAQILPAEDKPAETGKHPPRERRQLLNAIRRLGLADAAALPAVVPEDEIGIVRLSADENCTACGVCVRVCPTGAIQSQVRGEDFRLEFAPGACTDCGTCLDVCEPAALHRDGLPSLAQLVASEPLTLRSDKLQKCLRCGTLYAGKTTGRLCPICEFRRQNPFGSRTPARV